MKVRFKDYPKHILALIKEIGREAQKMSFHVYVVGGFVRDLILKKENLDVDIVVEPDAVEFAEILSRKKKARLTIYKRFRTATLIYPDGIQVDLATARKERYPYPGALPVVGSGTIYDDLARRDFTINAMAVCILPERFGEVMDIFGGCEDLKRRKIRFLHEGSFLDDPTRVLRAVRFETRFGFSIEPKTLRFLKEAMAQKVMSTVKAPRYFEEFKKILKERRFSKQYIKRLVALNALIFAGRNYKIEKETYRLLDNTVKETQWFEDHFPRKEMTRWLVYLMSLLSFYSKRQVKDILVRFQLRKEEKEKILALWNMDDRIRHLKDARVSPSDVCKALGALSVEALVVLRSRERDIRLRRFISDFLLKYESVRCYLNGEDLKYLGVNGGKDIGMILQELLRLKVNGIIHSRQDEIKMVKKLNRQQKVQANG